MNILTIGNSFSICLEHNLPQITAAGKKHHIKLTSAYIGGCPLELHAQHLLAAEEDITIEPYLISICSSDIPDQKSQRRGNVLELLQNNKYDIITLQQASPKSWDYSTYQPYADTVISYIKKYNPDAEIIIQQTWSYRSDALQLADFGFDSDEMYRRLCGAYQEFSAATGFRVIPTGDAVDIFRKNSGKVFKALPQEELDKICNPDLPSTSDDIVGKYFWRKDEEGNMYLGSDRIHLNFRGEYLQACVWYGKLFGEDPESIVYEHPQISSAECRALRKAAAQALAGTQWK